MRGTMREPRRGAERRRRGSSSQVARLRRNAIRALIVIRSRFVHIIIRSRSHSVCTLFMPVQLLGLLVPVPFPLRSSRRPRRHPAPKIRRWRAGSGLLRTIWDFDI